MKKRRLSLLVKLICFTVFLVAVILPLVRMLANLADTDVLALISSPRFVLALGHSFLASAVATVISISIASVLAWCVTRSGIKFKRFWIVLFTLPMLIPSISHGMGLIVLFGANGVLTNLLHLEGNIYGFVGIVVGSVMYSFPVAFLMISDVLRYEDSTPYEAARVLGIPPMNRFLAITVPYMRKPMIAAVFTVFTLTVTDYGVPLMVGGQYITLPVMMYQDVIGLLDFGKGSVIGLVLLIPAVVAFIIDLLNKDKGNASYIIKPFALGKRKGRDAVAYALSVLVGFCIVLPIVSFILLTFVAHYPNDLSLTVGNIFRALDMKAGVFLGNSIFISFMVAAVGVTLAFTVAYLTARAPSKFSKALHLISITSLAIPGLVLGLSFVLFFKGSLLYGTLAILILVNLMHFFSSPYLMVYNTLSKLNENLEAVGDTLGIRRISIIFGVIVPQSRLTLMEMFTYFFVNSMMTISAVSFLATSATRPVSLMIPSFETTMMLECAAFVSLLILIVNLLMSGMMGVLKKFAARERETA
jgi:iron(III) transport system permease protein